MGGNDKIHSPFILTVANAETPSVVSPHSRYHPPTFRVKKRMLRIKIPLFPYPRDGDIGAHPEIIADGFWTADNKLAIPEHTRLV